MVASSKMKNVSDHDAVQNDSDAMVGSSKMKNVNNLDAVQNDSVVIMNFMVG